MHLKTSLGLALALVGCSSAPVYTYSSPQYLEAAQGYTLCMIISSELHPYVIDTAELDPRCSQWVTQVRLAALQENAPKGGPGLIPSIDQHIQDLRKEALKGAL
jgi:hypothetical protein